MTSPHDETRNDPQEERPDATQELWGDTTAEHATAEQATPEFATAEQRSATDPTQQLPVDDHRAATEATPAGQPVPTTAPAAWAPPVPPRPTGPHIPAVLLGLVCLAVGGIVLAQELGNLTIDWGDVGPLGFVAMGAVLVVLGIVGLAGSNRRNARS
ncbi:hypothetical protein [Pedococcus sp. 2YAF34]|uniref:hypothetical protein n=1 Tax=Pedococcus sp. 2YAF34 TaxID=3233032 RepID=UPI003F9E9D12